MQVAEFGRNPSRAIRDAVDQGTTIPIEYYRKPCVTIVPTELWEKAEQALREQEMRERARRDKRSRDEASSDQLLLEQELAPLGDNSGREAAA